MTATKNRNPFPKGIPGYFTYPDGAREASRAKVIAKALSSKSEAIAFLKRAGIMDEKGELAEPYR